jgi:hypothetical protein
MLYIKGTIGAALIKQEIKKIESILEIVKKYTALVNRKWLEKNGFHKKDNGEFSIRNVNNNDCVFSYNDNGNAKFDFQNTYDEQKTDFVKPTLCHLFHIGV